MKFAPFLSFFVIFLIIFSSISLSVRDFTVGVSPPVVNLGDLERGTTKVVSFFIITPSEETLLVSLEPSRGTLDFFKKDAYRDFIFNSSEEDITPWIKILNNPVTLEPSNETLKTKYGIIRGQREISLILDIPKNADFGYHTVNIKPLPYTPTEEVGQVGTRIVAITSVNILFNVVGNAVRNGAILDVEPGGYRGRDLEIKTYFQNTGTTTISARATQRVYDRNGEFKEELYSGSEYFKPDEIKTLVSYLPTTGLSLGNYSVYTFVDYTTDNTTKNSVFTLREPSLPAPEAELFIPLWLIILVLMFLIAIIVYRRMK